ncbi:MAG: hypothetical protein E6J06_11190 [Chloroflexi bacterium]|nr:MAG: hypothetical protein E6J06_11190 [Chloroflexota bacterium]
MNRFLRMAGAASFLVSAAAFVAGLIALYTAEGPNAPNLWVYLADPSGRAVLDLATKALTVAILLFFVGVAILSMTLPPAVEGDARLARYLAAVAAAVFVGFLSLQYALVAVLDEGVAPTSQEFRILVLQAHATADWGGWTGIVLLAAALLLLGAALTGQSGRRITGWAAIIAAGLGLALIPAGFGFLFTVLAAIWAVLAAVDLVRVDLASGRT